MVFHQIKTAKNDCSLGAVMTKQPEVWSQKHGNQNNYSSEFNSRPAGNGSGGRVNTKTSQTKHNQIMHISKHLRTAAMTAIFLASSAALHASEADLKIPPLDTVKFDGLWGVTGIQLMYMGILMCAIGCIFGLVQYKQTKALPVHKSMAD